MFLQERKDMFSLLQSCKWNFLCCQTFGEKLENCWACSWISHERSWSIQTFLCTGQEGWWHGMIHVSGWDPFQTLPTSGIDRGSCCGSGGNCRWGMTAASLLTAALQRERRPSKPRPSHIVVRDMIYDYDYYIKQVFLDLRCSKENKLCFLYGQL